jgi:hypothetical protein
LSKTPNKLVTSLFETLKARGVSVPEFSEQTGIPKDRVYKWNQVGSRPKSEDEKIITEWISGEKMDNVPHGTSPHQRQSDNMANEALLIVARANDKLAESNLIISRSNEMLCRSNEELVNKIRISSTAEEDKYTLKESVYLLMGLREYMTEIASAVTNKSTLEVNQTLNSKVMAAKERVENKGSVSVVGK